MAHLALIITGGCEQCSVSQQGKLCVLVVQTVCMNEALHAQCRLQSYITEQGQDHDMQKL